MTHAISCEVPVPIDPHVGRPLWAFSSHIHIISILLDVACEDLLSKERCRRISACWPLEKRSCLFGCHLCTIRERDTVNSPVIVTHGVGYKFRPDILDLLRINWVLDLQRWIHRELSLSCADKRRLDEKVWRSTDAVIWEEEAFLLNGAHFFICVWFRPFK